MPNDMNTEQILAALQDPEQSDKIDMDDPKVIAAINSLSGADEALPGAEQDADAPAPGTEAEGEAADSNTEGAKAPANTEGKAAAEPEKVIVSKSGKNEIPYSVLEQARANEEAAVAAAQELANVVTALEARLKVAQGAAPAGEAAAEATDDLTAQLATARKAVEDLSKEYPDLAPAQTALLDTMLKMASTLETRLAEVEDVAVRTVHKEATDNRTQAAEALSEVPALVVWQTKKPELFALAAKFDESLKADPDWKGKPMQERFQAAVNMVVAAKGPGVLEGITPKQNTKESDKDTKGALAEKAKERLATLFGVSSLSDLPGGSAVAGDALAALEGLSDTQLADKLDRMGNDPNALLNFLAGSVGG